MKNFAKVITLLFLFSSQFYAQELLIFGGDNHDVFLGCLNCKRYDSNSIWSKHGTYGSKYNDFCIWNKYGVYGGKYGDCSPFNKYASVPPVLVDANGNFYGYFTFSRSVSNRTRNKLALYILENWEDIRDDVDKHYDLIF